MPGFTVNDFLMLRSTWPVVGFRPDSRWERPSCPRRGRDALNPTKPMAVGGGLKPPPTRVRNVSNFLKLKSQPQAQGVFRVKASGP